MRGKMTATKNMRKMSKFVKVYPSRKVQARRKARRTAKLAISRGDYYFIPEQITSFDII